MKRKINIQKTFNFVSIVFLGVCALIYGFRFLTLYIKNAKKMSKESNTLGVKLQKENKETLVKIDNDKYFKGVVDNNYVLYSGIVWRAIKISNNNVVTLVSDNAVTVLAYGENKEYDESYITSWLNKSDKEYSGLFENNMNNYKEFLTNGKVCNDKIESITNNECINTNEKYYFNTLTASDYINTGAQDGFLNTNESFYLSDLNKDNLVWYVNESGNVSKSKGNDVIGVKVVINLKETTPLVSGTGTKEDPYTFDSTKNNFGSYVKLDNDEYRVIGYTDNEYKLVNNNYLKDNNNNDIVRNFSKTSSNYDVNDYTSIANYLNNTYLNSLSYKDIIVESEYPCGYYGSANNYDYTETYKNVVKTKVALMSIGDIILNHELTDYFLLNSSSSKNTFTYTFLNKNSLFSKSAKSDSKVVPVITINKEKLVGLGTKDNPYRMENN